MPHTIRALGCLFVFIVLLMATVMAHLAATKTVPEGDTVVTESPDQIQVWFTQAPDPAVSKLAMEGPTGEVELGETKVIDQKSLMAMVPKKLQSGSYTVTWRTVGDDGHVQRGEFAFTVRSSN